MLKKHWQVCCAAMFLSWTTIAAADTTWDTITAEYSVAMENWNAEMMKGQGGGVDKPGFIKISDMSSMPPHPSEKFRPRVRA